MVQYTSENGGKPLNGCVMFGIFQPDIVENFRKSRNIALGNPSIKISVPIL